MFRLFRRMRARLKYRHFDRDLAREIEIHRAMKQDELEAGGVRPADARAASVRALGNVTWMREESRSVWIARWMEQAWQDVRYAVRGLWRQPGLAATAIGILGLSTGLLTTLVVFTDASLLRPWRVPSPEQIVLVRPAAPTADGLAAMRVPEYLTLKGQATSWREMALTLRASDEQLVFENGATAHVDSLAVTANYFEALGLQLAAGRTFSQEEGSLITPADVIIISHRLWQTHLDGDPAAVGRQARFGARPVTIIGVAPRGFIDGFGSHREVWFPLSLWLGGGTPEGRRAFLDPRHQSLPLNVFGRIGPGVSPAAALTELQHLSRVYRAEARIDPATFRLLDTRPISSPGNQDVLAVLGLVAGALFLVQVLACANVGNLLLARALARQREMAVRMSLGAGRGRVVRQLLTEAGLLIALSAGLGLTMALAVPSVVIPLVPDVDQRPEFFGPGLATFVTLTCLAALSTLVAGLAPALRATRVGLSTLAGNRHGPSRGGVRLQRMLLVVQIALATVLLSAAGLLTRGVGQALEADPGFPVENFQEVSFELTGTLERERRVAFFTQMFHQTRSAEWPPIAFADFRPIDDAPYTLPIRTASGSKTVVRSVLLRPVSENYFDVLGIRLLAGRMPASDSAGQEVVLNRLAADLLWPGESPLGKSIISGFRSDGVSTLIVVGVAPDLPGRTIVDRRPIAYRISSFVRPYLIVASRDPNVATRLEELAGRLEPGVAARSRPLDEMVAETMLPARIGGHVAWAIGALALVLATIGAFGVFAYAVEERRREVGIRMALGARASQVIGLVLGSTQAPVLLGVAIGAGAAAAASPLLRAHLYGLSPFDPIAYLQVAVILAAAATLATWIPARRATRVNPAETLRAE